MWRHLLTALGKPPLTINVLWEVFVTCDLAFLVSRDEAIMVEPVTLRRGQFNVFRQLEPEQVVQVVGGDAIGVQEDDPLELGQEKDVELLVAAAVVVVIDVGFQARKGSEIDRIQCHFSSTSL